MSISGKLLNPRLSKSNVLASVKRSLVGICRAGKILWVPKRKGTSQVNAHRQKLYSVQYETRQEDFYWEETSGRTEAFLWLRRKAKGNLSGLNVSSVNRGTIAQVLVWQRVRRNYSLTNFVKRNENIQFIRYGVSKPAPPCGEIRTGNSYFCLWNNGDP